MHFRNPSILCLTFPSHNKTILLTKFQAIPSSSLVTSFTVWPIHFIPDVRCKQFSARLADAFLSGQTNQKKTATRALFCPRPDTRFISGPLIKWHSERIKVSADESLAIYFPCFPIKIPWADVRGFNSIQWKCLQSRRRRCYFYLLLFFKSGSPPLVFFERKRGVIHWPNSLGAIIVMYKTRASLEPALSSRHRRRRFQELPNAPRVMAPCGDLENNMPAA